MPRLHALALLLLAGLLAPPARAAADEGSGARFTIRPAGSGPQRLDPPPAFLSASARGDLADLRLRAGDGAEVPYLLVPPPDAPPRWATAARLRPIPPTRTESGAEVDLGAVRTVAGLELELADRGFLKRARVEGSADGRRWTTLAEGEALYALPLDPAACGGAVCDGALERRAVRFPAATARWLRVVLDDRRSPRLGLPTGARALLAEAGAAAAGPSLPLHVEPRPGEPGTSRFALRLPGPHLPVRAVILEVDAPRLARRARVLEARLAGGRLAPVELGSARLAVVERDGERAAELRVPVATPEEQELELVVEDGDNPPLPLRGARAELAPQPWIFFESRDGAPIEARLGDPARAAPRYDLEALRPQLARLTPARATAAAAEGTATPPAAGAAPPPEAAGPGARVERRDYRLARSIPAGAPGLAAVRLDADVLAWSSLADLRLVGGDGRQVPYLLEQRDEPLALPLAEAADAPAQALRRAGVTVHAYAVRPPAFPEARLVLTTSTRVFTRQVRIYAAPEPRTGHGPALLASASWAHADPGRAAPPLAVDLPALRTDQLLVAVEDGDNAPLAVTAARLLLPSYRLRFFHPGPALELWYGAAGPAEVEAPRYDLALLAPRLRAEAAREVALGPAPAAAAEAMDGGRAGRLAFWAVLGLAVVGLLALVGRLVLRGGDPGAPGPG